MWPMKRKESTLTEPSAYIITSVLRVPLRRIVFGSLLLFAWFFIHFHRSELSSVPSESIVPRQYIEAAEALEHFEELIRIGAISLLTLGFVGLWELAPTIVKRQSATRFDALFVALPTAPDTPRQPLPRLITADIDACITPNQRGVVNLRNVHKLRQYCAFARIHKDYPPFILVSARSQEYTELLCQTLDIINGENDVPCVVENGMALYFPHKRAVRALVDNTQVAAVQALRAALVTKIGSDYEFEPKQFMITINVEPQRGTMGESLRARRKAVHTLRKLVDAEIVSASLNSADYDITTTDNAVDIVPSGISKLTGLQAVLENPPLSGVPLGDVASIGNSEADEPVLEVVGRAFCSLDALPGLQSIVRGRNPDNCLGAHDSDAVVAMVAEVSGVTLI
jgi:HAD superfamily hydrolase (TIGR01484 family)